MGDTYTRQSSSTIVDGTTIEAAHFNNEFDQLVAAFAVSSGHTHDGTTAEGGPVTKLLGTAITIGDATAGTDITVTFDGESNDGVLAWMEDEDYFKFSDDILLNSTERLNFGDTGTYIFQSTDGQLDIVADTELQIAATTVDINGNVDISGTLTVAGAVDFGDAALSNVGAVQLDSISGDGDTNTSITFSGSDVITIATGGSGRLTIGDGALSPVTNNQIDLGTASLEFKDGYFDGTVTADAFAGPLTGNVTGNVSGTAATVTTAAQSNITSLGTLTTLTVDNIITNGTTIGHTDDTDLLTLASGVLTVAGELDAVSLDISGDADIDGTLEADAITIGGITLAETIADTVGAMVTSNTESGITVAYDDADNTLDFTVGTLNQNTTGSAATLTTARTIGGTSFDGSADIAVGLACNSYSLSNS
jgi:cytoskeletal protein CcmA (bactofilin family)